MKKPVVLAIIDGLGFAPASEANPWVKEKAPFLDFLMQSYPKTKLKAAGPAVGLPANQMGNSEAGHLNIGAGRIVKTGLTQVSDEIAKGALKTNVAFQRAIDHSQKQNSTLHVVGLLSPGGVHSHESHLWAILDFLAQRKVAKVTVHVIGDGRDTAKKAIMPSLEKLLKLLKEHNYQLGSIQGRFYAMDRDQIFTRSLRAFEALRGNSKETFDDPRELVRKYYSQNITDEFFTPAINKSGDTNFLTKNDSVILFNFRPDRMRQLAHLLVGSHLYETEDIAMLDNLHLTTMMEYVGITKADVAFRLPLLTNTLGEVIASNDLTQLRLAETQKYAHVTFFFDGGQELFLKGQERILVPSLKIENFAKEPQMSAQLITQKLIDNLANFDFVVLNYANCDMVGHTGDFGAAQKALQVVDSQIQKIYDATKELKGTLFVTADHGNLEEMKSQKGEAVTQHTVNDVPFIVCDKSISLISGGSLSNIAPTILDYLKIKAPLEMSSSSLLKRK